MDRNNDQSMDSIDSLDVDNKSRSAALSHADQSTQSSMFAASSPAAAAAATPPGSPTATNTTDSMNNPTNVNMGLRQRRRPASNSATTQQQQSHSQPDMCDTPTRRTQDILDGFDNHLSNQHNAVDDVVVDGNGNNPSVQNTPVHRKSSRFRRDDNDAVQIPINAAVAAASVPSRPVPISPWMPNSRSSQPAQQNTNNNPHEHENERTTNTFQPDLNGQMSPIPSSSPF